ncbi:hypothetical protein Tco_1229347 [Tanacetum coccineum]
MNIIKDHPLRFSIAASSSVPWIYMAQFWHTLKEDGSKYRLTLLDKKMLSPTLDDFRTIFHLPQATDNNHDSFQEARENVELVNKHLASEEIEKMVDEPENIIDDSPIPRNDDQNIPGTRLEPRSDKESPEMEITNVVIPVNVNEEEEEITDEVYELKQREKWKIVEESRSTPSPTPIRSPRIHTDLVSSDTEKLQELTETDTTPTLSSSSLNTKLSTTNRLLSLFKAKPARFKPILHEKSFDTLADHLQEVMVESLPTMVDKHINEQVEKQVPEDQDDPHDDAPPEGENSAKWQKTSEYEAHVTGESSGQVNESEQSPSSSGNQEQVDDYDFWTESYASDDDEIPTKQKIADEMLRQRCTSGDEHQYHIDQMKNFLKSDIVWESRKEILASPHPRKTTPLVQSC